MDSRILQIVLQAKDEASAKLKKFGDSAEKTGDSIKQGLEKNVASLGAAFAVTTGVIVSSIAAYSEAENNAAQLEAVLKSTGNAAGLTKDQILDQAAALQQMSTFSDDAVTSTANLLLTFTNIKGPIMQQALQMTTDMSTALGQDLQSSAIQLGKALNDPIKGITALSRVGVSFTQEQKDQIETLVESGKTMDAQKVILGELSKEFGGSALAQSKTFSGQMTILKNNVGDLQETLGQGLVEALTSAGGGFENVNKTIINLNTFLIEHKDVLQGIVYALGFLALAFGALFVAATASLLGIGVIAVGLAALIIASIGYIVGQVVYNFEMMKNNASTIINNIKGFFIDLRDSAVARIESIKSGFQNTFNAIPGIVRNILSQVGIAIANFNPIIRIAVDLPDIIGAFNNLRANARKAGIPGFATGGWVGDTGLAVVHKGEYVLSKDMLAGRQQIQAPISGGATVTLGPVYVNDMNDVDSMLRRISNAYKFDSSI